MGRVVSIFLGLILVAAGVLMLFKDAYGESIAGASESIAVNFVAMKINASLKEGIYSSELDGPLIHVERDENGNIKYLEPDSRLINKLVLEFMTEVNDTYNLDDTQAVKVNLGVITGSKILSQLPFTVKVKVQPLSLTRFQYETEFETQGINQTRYCVYCTINSQVRILAPFTDKVSEINRRFLLAEAIIVGDVPGNYVEVPKESILDAIDSAE
ncbi:MAG: sporulation protein YunB [Anaerovoracaceae bacterium]|nr:sporulation protein YunB [Anaerovoracaceae bacterium]